MTIWDNKERPRHNEEYVPFIPADFDRHTTKVYCGNLLQKWATDRKPGLGRGNGSNQHPSGPLRLLVRIREPNPRASSIPPLSPRGHRRRNGDFESQVRRSSLCASGQTGGCSLLLLLLLLLPCPAAAALTKTRRWKGHPVRTITHWVHRSRAHFHSFGAPLTAPPPSPSTDKTRPHQKLILDLG